jgi:hypothetical protein
LSYQFVKLPLRGVKLSCPEQVSVHDAGDQDESTYSVTQKTLVWFWFCEESYSIGVLIHLTVMRKRERVGVRKLA